MLRKLVWNESGITMGLVVIMIVLIGVMGAGLLTFVQRDLNAVVEVNQGQRALEVSEAGMEAAERHLALEDATKENYDGDNTNGDSEWSYLQGKNLTLSGNSARVTIQYLTPSTTTAEATSPNNAPEVNASGQYANGRNYFKVISRGRSGGAVRHVEAIYRTTNHNLPTAYYATRDIDLNGNVTTVDGISVFAGRNVLDVRADRIIGTDQAYGNWKVHPITGVPNGFNNTARSGPDGVETTAAGVAALGTVNYSPSSEDTDQKNGPGVGTRYGKIDFDANSDNSPVSSKEFKGNNQPNAITFPFEIGNATADDATIETLRSKAISQSKYIRLPSGSNLTIEEGAGAQNYPSTSDLGTVFFVEFVDGPEDNPTYGTKGTVTYSATTSNVDGYGKGVVVVVNGDLSTSPSAEPYEGVFVVRDPNDADAQVMEYKNAGNLNVRGFANVEGDITLSGETGTALVGGLVGGIPGLYRTEQWSWRECYSAGCS